MISRQSLFMICIAVFSLYATGTVSGQEQGLGQAILMKGSDPVKGVPGFGKNALPALYGEYTTSVAGEDLVLRVWATREALYLKAGFWTARKSGTYTFREAKAPENDDELPAGTAFLLTLVERPFLAGGLGSLPDEWSVVFALPARSVELDRFQQRFLDRFNYFLSQARMPTDASFPANVEY
jgi:hypothetical protein